MLHRFDTKIRENYEYRNWCKLEAYNNYGSVGVLKLWLDKQQVLLFEPMYYNEYRKKENQWGLVQAQKLETQSNRCDAAIIFRADRITNVSEVNQQSSRRNRKERNNLIQWMEVEMGKKGNWISQYNNTLVEEERIKVINNPYKSKRTFIELRRGSCVLFGVYWCELCTELCVSFGVYWCELCTELYVSFGVYWCELCTELCV